MMSMAGFDRAAEIAKLPPEERERATAEELRYARTVLKFHLGVLALLVVAIAALKVLAIG